MARDCLQVATALSDGVQIVLNALLLAAKYSRSGADDNITLSLMWDSELRARIEVSWAPVGFGGVLSCWCVVQSSQVSDRGHSILGGQPLSLLCDALARGDKVRGARPQVGCRRATRRETRSLRVAFGVL